MKPRIIGRSSSHHTRVARIFAGETGVKYDFEIVRDLMSRNPSHYAGNPALKLPVLQTSDGTWYGTLTICRVLSRISKLRLEILWPEALASPLLSNAQELTTQAMATEVSLILSRLVGRADGPAQVKLLTSLSRSLVWLDERIDAILQELPRNRDLSYLEVTLFCLLTHLKFREVLSVAPYSNLEAFCRLYGERKECRDTPYAFDP